MSLTEPAAIGYLLSFAAYAALVFRLSWRSATRLVPRALWIAGASMALWSAAQLFYSLDRLSNAHVLAAVDWLRNLAWLTVLLLFLVEVRAYPANIRLFRNKRVSGAMVAALAVAFAAVASADSDWYLLNRLLGFILAATVLLVCEQIIRHAHTMRGSLSHYVCITAGGLYLFELIKGIPIGPITANLSSFELVQGWISAIVVLPLVVALRSPMAHMQREPDDPDIRPFVFRWFLALSLATALLTLLIADFYVQSLGGSWPEVIRAVVIAGVVCFAGVLAVSPALRGQLRVFLTKSFLSYKYDYRKEWLRFIGTLSETGLSHLPSTSVQAIARIVNSSAGVVWVFDADSRRYTPIGAWQHPLPLAKTFSPENSLVRFMVERQWVIDLTEMQQHPSMYGNLELDSWFEGQDKWWIIVPMLLGSELYGFVALMRGPALSTLNFEDHDLLRTVGRHVATHLKQAESDRQLSEAQQFSTYHRLSAFLMHDLNNLAAQLSLVVKNAEKHRHDPKFIDDMIATVAHSVSRMNRVLEQLSDATERSSTQKVNLIPVLERAVMLSAPRQPRPSLKSKEKKLMVLADPERLCGVLEHLIRNAQDATDDNGRIEISVETSGATATVRIADTGCGMSDDFINERLFRPFDSTKGSQSMGIGAYQAREYIRSLGGHVDVESTPGVGSAFTIELDVAR